MIKVLRGKKSPLWANTYPGIHTEYKHAQWEQRQIPLITSRAHCLYNSLQRKQHFINFLSYHTCSVMAVKTLAVDE